MSSKWPARQAQHFMSSSQRVRFATATLCLFLTLMVFALSQHRDFKVALHHYRYGMVEYAARSQVEDVRDKVVVMAKTRHENTDWVATSLPDWQQAIYTVDDPSAALHTPTNKGHEGMAYLTYIIEHYKKLPSTVAFVHSHRGGWLSYWHGWHTDSPAFDNVISLRSLQLDFVQRNGYANLRCTHLPGCGASYETNTHITPALWQEFFNSTRMPERIAAACCAQFAVSRTQILARPLKDYVAYRRWLLNTELGDAASGRVLEYMWHVIFGRDGDYCPDLASCYCNVYGQC